MISPPKDSNAHLASAWTAGVAVLFLGIGLQGAVTPLLPDDGMVRPELSIGDEVMIEDFDPPAAPPDQELPEEEPEQIEEVEIPPLPVIEAPLTPPEMVEITPLEPVLEKAPVPQPPPEKPPEPKPKPVNKPAPARPRPQPSAQSGGRGNGSTSGAPTVFTGGGRGRFPQPGYPASARSAKQQGSVRVLVVVEASGLPSSVSISSSSGFAALDEAARDQISRRWRWPAGEVRRYIVPVRFVLQ